MFRIRRVAKILNSLMNIGSVQNLASRPNSEQLNEIWKCSESALPSLALFLSSLSSLSSLSLFSFHNFGSYIALAPNTPHELSPNSAQTFPNIFLSVLQDAPRFSVGALSGSSCRPRSNTPWADGPANYYFLNSSEAILAQVISA